MLVGLETWLDSSSRRMDTVSWWYRETCLSASQEWNVDRGNQPFCPSRRLGAGVSPPRWSKMGNSKQRHLEGQTPPKSMITEALTVVPAIKGPVGRAIDSDAGPARHRHTKRSAGNSVRASSDRRLLIDTKQVV